MFFKLGLHKWVLLFVEISTKHPTLGWTEKDLHNLDYVMLNRNANALDKSTWKMKRKTNFPETIPRPQKKTLKLPCETPNGMDLSCHRSKTHIQRCCRDEGTFTLWKTEKKNHQLCTKVVREKWTYAPFESWVVDVCSCANPQQQKPKPRFFSQNMIGIM